MLVLFSLVRQLGLRDRRADDAKTAQSTPFCRPDGRQPDPAVPLFMRMAAVDGALGRRDLA
ncbi:hypothetical protein ACVWWK_002658 [Bradyrhizobium sp. LB9.1b]